MSHRTHLTSLKLGFAFREACLTHSYALKTFGQDAMAGITVGIIAIPLAMALAIACGIAPQHGLYTAIIAGFLIALTGGSRLSISGPTAAFVVILYPVVQKYGLGGLLLATFMAGCMMIGMAYARLGRLIEYVPESVTLGFTGGIAVVIATLQIRDLLGLSINTMPEHFTDKILTLWQHAHTVSWAALSVGAATLAVMIIWPRLKTPIPPHLPAVVAATLLAWGLQKAGISVETIATQFRYDDAHGVTHAGIPPFPPTLSFSWFQIGPNGQPLNVTWPLIVDLLPSAFAIAMLGAIESLLCAVILDGMTGRRHSANSELLGQGLGNIIVPFFGGITATAALARSVANWKAGAKTPAAAIIHACVVLIGLMALAPLLSYLPMAGMAALLLVVAWNMSEFHKSFRFIRLAPRSDVIVLITCLLLTVFFDMVIAISVGILLATVLFMKDIAALTRLEEIPVNTLPSDNVLPRATKTFKIKGPLFFAAADRVFGELGLKIEQSTSIILILDDVPLLDAGGLAALTRFADRCIQDQTALYLCGWQFQPLKTLAKAKFNPNSQWVMFFPDLQKCLEHLDKDSTRSLQCFQP